MSKHVTAMAGINVKHNYYKNITVLYLSQHSTCHKMFKK